MKKALGVKQGGKFLARAIEGLLEWQLDHEEADEAAAEAWLLGQRENLGLPIANSIDKGRTKYPNSSIYPFFLLDILLLNPASHKCISLSSAYPRKHLTGL